jgi:hypothetical protein
MELDFAPSGQSPAIKVKEKAPALVEQGLFLYRSKLSFAKPCGVERNRGFRGQEQPSKLALEPLG